MHFWNGNLTPREEQFAERVPTPLERLEELLEEQAHEDYLDETEMADAVALGTLRAQVSVEGAEALAHPDPQTANTLAVMVCIAHGRRYADLMDLTGQRLTPATE